MEQDLEKLYSGDVDREALAGKEREVAMLDALVGEIAEETKKIRELVAAGKGAKIGVSADRLEEENEKLRGIAERLKKLNEELKNG